MLGKKGKLSQEYTSDDLVNADPNPGTRSRCNHTVTAALKNKHTHMKLEDTHEATLRTQKKGKFIYLVLSKSHEDGFLF